MENSMKDLLALLRAMQLFYHNCHNVTFGASFVGDHALFADFYGQIEADYDSLAERMIGLYGRSSLSLKAIMEKAEDLVEEMQDPSSMAVEGMFAQGGIKEFAIKELCAAIDSSSDASVGVKNLVGTLCDNAEIRMYKIRQRLTNE